jgi:hypothetical protein
MIGALINPAYFQSLNMSKSVSFQDYLSAMIGTSIITTYLKVNTVREINLYQSLNNLLSIKVSEAKVSKMVLTENSEALEAVQNKLEQELNKRTHSLQLQNEALEKYIQYNTTKLEEPIKNLKSSIGELQDASIYSDLLKASQEELDLVLNQINEGLRLKGQINRNEIMKNG